MSTHSLFLRITRLERGQDPPLPYSICQGLISKLSSATRKTRNLHFQQKLTFFQVSRKKVNPTKYTRAVNGGLLLFILKEA